MSLTNSRVLVIGGAGFIGSHVVAELLATDVGTVVVYDNFARGRLEYLAPYLKDPRCSIFPYGGDIRSTDVLDVAVRDADYVICLAGLWLLHCRDFPRSAFEVNIAGTFNVLEACARHGVKRLIWSSSASVYGDAVETPMTESHPFNNRNFYGATKIAGEAMATAFFERYGLSIIGLRYMNVYGPHQDQLAAYSGVIPSLLNAIEGGTSPVINGDGSQSYDFLYVEDAARCNVLALESPVPFGMYNVGTGVRTSIRELCDLILELTRSSVTVSYQPYAPEDARALVTERVGATEKAQRDLGFRYRYDLRSGLERLIAWRTRSGLPSLQS
jgi:UDP-glucose 4-epimerase